MEFPPFLLIYPIFGSSSKLKCLSQSPGSTAEVPKDYLSQIKEFEDVFTVDSEKLKQIVDHFVHELEKGWLRRLRCL